MEGRWYYLESETATGPFSLATLRELGDAGLIGSATYVWREGDPSWILFQDALAALGSPPSLPAANFVSSSATAQDSTTVVDLGSLSPAPSSWSTSPVSPWRRYGARMIDTHIHGMVGMFILGFTWYSIAPLSADKFFALFEGPQGIAIDFILTLLAAALVGGFVVGATGTSLGKSIFGIKVLSEDLRAIGITAGLAREFRVWVAGLGFGIPIVSLFTMIAAYGRLNTEGKTSWDAGRHVVQYRRKGAFQTTMNVFGTLLVVALIILARGLAAQR